MSDDFKELREALKLTMPIWWLMHDNHTFTKLVAGDVDASMAILRGIEPKRLAYGMLCAKGERRGNVHCGDSGQMAIETFFAIAEAWMRTAVEPQRDRIAVDPAQLEALLNAIDAARNKPSPPI